MAEIDKQQRDKRIREMMEVSGLDEDEAAFAVDIELGLIPGDVIVEKDNHANTK